MLGPVFTDDKGELPPRWQWPGLWSVNLPILVILWQSLFARAFYVPLTDYHYFATAALTWIFVALERWICFFRQPLPAGTEAPAPDLTEERGQLLRICGIVLLSLAIATFFRATSSETAGILILTSLGGLYLVCLAAAPRLTTEYLPREMALPGYLAGALALFIWANSAFSPMRVLLPVLLFLLLLFYYICLVASWGKRQVPAPLATGALLAGPLGTLYRALPLGLIFAGAALSLLGRSLQGDPILLSLGVSGLILLLLDRWSPALGGVSQRILADAALLTPALPLLITFGW